MMQKITMENLKDTSFDIFRMFAEQTALVTAGTIDHFNTMTIGWGMLGNVWGHTPGITIYVSPSRYTWEFLEKNELFTITFFPKQYNDDLLMLGSVSGRDRDKVAESLLTPKDFGDTVGFEEASLTLVCRKLYGSQFDRERTPAKMERLYSRVEPHYAYIGEIIDAFGEI